MKRSWMNFIIDGITALVAMALVWTGLLLHYLLPPGSGRDGLGLWGLNRHAWGDLHFCLSLSTLALVAIHVGLHWTWVCTMITRVFSGEATPRRRWRNLAGLLSVTALVVVIGGGLWYAGANVIAADEFREHDGRDGPARQTESVSSQQHFVNLDSESGVMTDQDQRRSEHIESEEASSQVRAWVDHGQEFPTSRTDKAETTVACLVGPLEICQQRS